MNGLESFDAMAAADVAMMLLAALAVLFCVVLIAPSVVGWLKHTTSARKPQQPPRGYDAATQHQNTQAWAHQQPLGKPLHPQRGRITLTESGWPTQTAVQQMLGAEDDGFTTLHPRGTAP